MTAEPAGRVLITGSSDGIGAEAARRLIALGRPVVLHARDDRRAVDAGQAVPGAEHVLVGDLGSIEQTRALADEANVLGRFETVIHNAGVGYRESRRITGDGLEHVFQINVLAPYLLTALIARPDQLVYLTSGLHRQGAPDLSDINWERRPWDGMQAYSDSKLLDVLLAQAVARLWPDVRSNSVEPGWVRSKMGGAGAPRSLAQGADTLVWLATTADAMSGRNYEDRRERSPDPRASDRGFQDALLELCRGITGESLG